MKKLLFVYNPRAGKEMLKPRLSDVLDIFVKAGYEVTVHPTQAYRDAYYQIKEYEVGKYNLIACSGGDGTIDEVATGMMKRREMGKSLVLRLCSVDRDIVSLSICTVILFVVSMVILSFLLLPEVFVPAFLADVSDARFSADEVCETDISLR